MHLLYLDESGQHKGRYFVLGGLAVHEKQTYFLGKELDDIQAETFPDMNEAIPFHAAEIRAGSKEPWKALPQKKRWAILDRLSDVIAGGRNTLFAEVIERGSLPEKKMNICMHLKKS
jgi:hypothetical protein